MNGTITLERKANAIAQLKYAQIRENNPKPFGAHWECFGVRVGASWADPDYLGAEGEYSFFALTKLLSDPTWQGKL